MLVPRILITPGEPAGIGPDVAIRMAQNDWPAELVMLADPRLMLERAKAINLPLTLLSCDLEQPPTSHPAQTLKIIPIDLITPAKAGELNKANAHYVIRTLEMAAQLCLSQKAQAVVTGPVHKGVVNDAGIAFSGHTEFFAHHCHQPLTVMLFVVDNLKIALATTHLPLKQVPSAITKEHLRTILSLLNDGLKKQFHLTNPRITVCGLNPHAGENGYLGREEIDVIIPLLNALRDEQFDLRGPLPADTVFTPAQLAQTDAVLAMYHDQALPLVKYLGFDRAVNVTLGLPFIRTSVDHGTALSIAGTSIVDPGSMKAAIALAIKLSMTSLTPPSSNA